MAASSTGTAGHWDAVYRDKTADSVSWYQPTPEISLHLLAASPGESVIDVGAGASTLVDRLLDAGVADLTVLDVSAEAIEVVRRRMGSAASDVSFVCADVGSWQPARTYDAWHDRAVLHFLTDTEDRARYVRTAGAAVRPGGRAVLGVFAEDGPEQCSGLPTNRSSAADLATLFASQFDLEHAEREQHVTPWGSEQTFTWVRLRRTDAR